ncbi:MAG: hypothetical protein U0529_05425 [Thermoanaerobaculia bacterium]
MSQDDGKTTGGSGGGPVSGFDYRSSDETYVISANQVGILCDAPLTAVPPQSVITLLAAGEDQLGVVDVHGTYGVRVSAGLPGVTSVHSVTMLPGVEIEVAPTHSIKLQQGLEPPAGQKIEMMPGLGVTVNAGALPVRIESATLIELTVAGGTSKIVLSPAGVEIIAPDVRIVGIADATMEAPRATVRAAATATITAPMTMINPV